jgi:hypothetical protein
LFPKPQPHRTPAALIGQPPVPRQRPSRDLVGAGFQPWPYAGGFNSLASHPIAFDLSGSEARTVLSVRPHCTHSKVRSSKPSGPGVMSTVIMRAVHAGQCRPIGGGSGSCFLILAMHDNTGPFKRSAAQAEYESLRRRWFRYRALKSPGHGHRSIRCFASHYPQRGRRNARAGHSQDCEGTGYRSGGLNIRVGSPPAQPRKMTASASPGWGRFHESGQASRPSGLGRPKSELAPCGRGGRGAELAGCTFCPLRASSLRSRFPNAIDGKDKLFLSGFNAVALPCYHLNCSSARSSRCDLRKRR